MRRRLPVPVVILGVLCSVLYLGWLGAGHLAGRASQLDRFETALLDLRFALRGPRLEPDDVAIVAIDDATVASEGGYPLGRDRLAELVDVIAEAGATALAVDLLFVDETEHDPRLAQALARLPVVVAGAGVFQTPPRLPSAVPQPDAVILPTSAIAGAAQVGLVNVATDAGGTPRHVPLLFLTQEGPQQSLVLAAASLTTAAPAALTSAGLVLGERQQRLDIGLHLPINPYGPRGTIHTISAQDLLAGGDLSLEGRIVLLGVTATGVGDQFATPYDRVLPGVEVLATGVANLLDGTALIRDDRVRRIDVAATGVLVLAGLAALSFLTALHGSVIFMTLLAGWLAIVGFAFGQHIWLSGAFPLGASLPPVLIFALVRLRHDRRLSRTEARALSELSGFQAPVLARIIVEKPAFLREPVERQAAILFVDLSGFTGLSERVGTAKTRDLLRSFHTLVVEVSDRHSGIVLNFMGDGAMLGFGLLEQSPEVTAKSALDCAFDLDASLRNWSARSDPDAPVAGSRIGLHFGPVVWSRLGHEHQQHIAATGDSVNVASRLCDMCKDHDATVAVSARLLEALPVSDHRPAGETAKTLAIRGRSEPMDISFWRTDGA